jgi:uncharacterized protein (DUF2267 family)
MKKAPSLESIDRTLSQSREWLAELSRQLDTEDPDELGSTLRSVLHALRDRLPVIASVRFGAQLPALLRGIYYEGWQPDRGHVHTRSLAEFLALVERDAPHGSPVDPEEKVRAVFRLLGARLETAAMDSVLAALPLPVQQLFPRPLAPASERSRVLLAAPSAKSA